MSIQSEISRIKTNIANALNAVAAKGVTIPTGANSDSLAELINQISSTVIEPSYTNLRPTAINLDGTPYGGVGKGYKPNVRLGSSGTDSTETAATTYAIGFIRCKKGDVIRCKNLGFRNATVGNLTASNQRIGFYNTNKTLIGTISNAGQVCTGKQLSGVVNSDGDLVQFTVENYSSVDLSAVEYFRLNGYYIGDDTIITVNEEIVDNAGG